MQFQVPQFIDVEDKIIGPLTLKEFIYLAIAGGICFIFFFILQTWLWIIFTAVIGTVAVALAFVRYNGRPLLFMLLSALKFLWSPKFYLWRRAPTKEKLPTLVAPKTQQQPLKHLWFKLNTSTEAIEKREKSFSVFSFFKKPAELAQHYEATKKGTGDEVLSRRVDYR